MKRLIYFLLIIFSITIASSQDNEPNLHVFKVKGDSICLLKDSSYFKQNKFILGWHWGGSYKISKALNINQYDGGTRNIHENVSANTNFFVKSDGIYTHCVGPDLLHAKAIYLFPALLVDKTYQNLNKINDNMNPVFGFNTINSKVTNGLTNGRSYIKLDSNKYSNNEVIIQSPWNLNILTNDKDRYTYDLRNQDQIKMYGGFELYLTINIQRLDNAGYQGDTLLKIELPYKWRYEVLNPITGNTDVYLLDSIINFSGIPGNSDTLKNRGLYKTIDSSKGITKSFIISPQMLPSKDSSITISARILFNNVINKYLRSNPNINAGCKNNEIDSLFMRVLYGNVKNCPVKIHWIKLETPNASKLFAGDYDKEITDSVQAAIDSYENNPAFKANGSKLFRLISHVEPGAQDWASMRYFNKLVGDIVVNEAGTEMTKLYQYVVGMSENWLGTQKFPTGMAVPFMYLNNVNPPDSLRYKSLGFEMGYKFNWNGTPHDTLNSGYETWTRSLMPIDSFKTQRFSDYINSDNICYSGAYISTQAFLENLLYTNFYSPFCSGFQYSNNPWWNQAFVLVDWVNGITDIKNHIATRFNPNHRLTTGEEIRYFTWNGIIMGAKGLFLDGPDDGLGSVQFRLNAGDSLNNALGINNDSVSDMDFLKRDDIGSDYIRVGKEHMEFDKKIDYNSVNNYFRTDTNHIFLGRKSMRLELKKMYDWVNIIGDKLMNLRLVAWRGIGYKTWANHHPSLWFDPISRYIDTTFSDGNSSSVRIYAPQSAGNPPISQHPFYDLTMHKILDTALDTRFMLGIQNRRTDPLLYEPGYFDNAMKFVPTAEFDEYVQNGGLNIPASKWQDFWWHRLGCRNIKVRFIKPSEFTNFKATYKIKEIAKGTAIDNNWWRDPKYMHVPDTTLVIWPREKEAEFSVRMLPGEGKMLEVTPTFENIADKCMECDQIKNNFRASITKHNFVWGDLKFKYFAVNIANVSQCYYDSLKLRLYYKPFLPKVGIIQTPNLTVVADTTKGYLDITYSQPQVGDTTGLAILFLWDNITKLELKVLDRFGEECPTPLDTFSQVFPPLCRDYVNLRFREGSCSSNYTDTIFATYNQNYPKVTLNIVKTIGNAEPDTSFRQYSGSFIDTMYTGSFKNSRGTYTIYIFDNGKYVCEESFSISRNSCPAKIKIETKDDNIKPPLGHVSINCKMKVIITGDSNLCNQRYEIVATNFTPITGFISASNPKVETYFYYGPGLKTYTINVYGEDGVTICSSKKMDLCCEICPIHYRELNHENDFSKYILSLAFEKIDDPGIICTHVGVIRNQTQETDNPVYGAVIYNTDNPMEVFYEEYRDYKTQPEFNLTTDYDLTRICRPEDMPLRFTLALLDKDRNIITETAFDSTFVVRQNPENLTVLSVTGEPNPTSGNYSLSYSLSRNAETSILITDRFGLPVLTTDLGEVSAGLHRQNFDFSSLSNGTYYGIVRANGEAKSILFAVFK